MMVANIEPPNGPPKQSSEENVDNLKAKTFKEVVVGERVSLPPRVKFMVQAHKEEDDGGSTDRGKCSLASSKMDTLIINLVLHNAICEEDNQLKNVVIVLASMDLNKVLDKKYMGEWLTNIWGKKLGIHFS